jgi:hypothetical protein
MWHVDVIQQVGLYFVIIQSVHDISYTLCHAIIQPLNVKRKLVFTV